MLARKGLESSEIQSLAPGALLWQRSICTTHVCDCKVQEDEIELCKVTCGLDMVSCIFGLFIWRQLAEGVCLISEQLTAKNSLKVRDTYYAYYAHYVHSNDNAHYALRENTYWRKIDWPIASPR